MEAIYTPYHWFLSVKMLNRYTTSRTSTKYHEIQLRLPNSKFIMIPIFEPLILNFHCTKWIVRKNVWKLNLETITMTIMFCHSYTLDVQILSSNNRKNDLILILTSEKQDKTLELSKHWSVDSTPARNEVIMKRTYPVKSVKCDKICSNY